MLEDESIQSEDITNMLQKVMGVSNGFDDIDIIINNIDSETYAQKVPVPKIEIIDDDDDDEKIINGIDEGEIVTVVDDSVAIESETNVPKDDIVFTKSSMKEDLAKKTNEELKSLLKELGVQTKGNKTELVERILNSA